MDPLASGKGEKGAGHAPSHPTSKGRAVKKNVKKIEKQDPSAKPTRRVVVLRELVDDELSNVAGGVPAPQRPWIWSP
jgi:hypothetical protein